MLAGPRSRSLARLVNDFPSQADMLTHGVVVGRWSLVVGHWSLVVAGRGSLTNDPRPTTNDQRPMTTIAWFSPLPPVRSGIADANAELLPHLERELAIDRFDEPRAHDFIWRNQRAPYDLIVYQLGNASCHDFVWAYLARFPGLVVVHDPTLHHARARQLLAERRFDDYRREFWFDHPAANRDFVEYAVEGLGGPIYYFWSMLPAVMKTARMVAVHNERVAADLREEFPQTPIAAIHLGTAPIEAS